MHVDEQFADAVLGRLGVLLSSNPSPEPDQGPGEVTQGARPLPVVPLDPDVAFAAAVRTALRSEGI